MFRRSGGQACISKTSRTGEKSYISKHTSGRLWHVAMRSSETTSSWKECQVPLFMCWT
uniref:Uncharacterized protein n=1 Tax=Arundo donax TaxID=35708 RepID=A0A0A9PTN6_ARUDO